MDPISTVLYTLKNVNILIIRYVGPISLVQYVREHK